MNPLPTPTRTLRNEIARQILGSVLPVGSRDVELMRSVLDDAEMAVAAIRNFVLVFGPDALIGAL